MAHTSRITVTQNTGGVNGLKKGMMFIVPNTPGFPPNYKEITDAANSLFGLRMRAIDVSTSCLRIDELK